MGDLHAEGDLEGVSDRQVEFIIKVVQDLGITSGTVKLQPVGKVGDNYAANVKRIIVERDGKPFSMIAKVATGTEIIRAAMNMEVLFRNEHIMYTEVLPKFTELQKSAGIPIEDRFKYAMCYGSLSEPPNEVIILEDLANTNYEMLDRFISLDDATVRLVLKNFANLHSLSYALRKEDPELYESFMKRLLNPWIMMAETNQMDIFFSVMEIETAELLEENYKKALVGTLNKTMEYSKKVAQVDATSKYSIIQQGDAWTNNIMFRLEDGKPVTCCNIDYQISKCGSPVGDLLYMIFNCTDYETRSKHYYDWIDYYHLELDKSLADYGLKVNFVYPRDQLDVDLIRYAKFALGLSIMVGSAIMRDDVDAGKIKDMMKDEELIQDMSKMTKVLQMGPESEKKFKVRVEGLIRSFTEYGYI